MRVTQAVAEPMRRPAGLPSPSELPALVAYATSLVETAHGKSQSQATFMLVQARDYLDALPCVLDRALAIDGLGGGVWWALRATRLLARTARVKVDAVLAVPEQPVQGRFELHRALKSQMDLVLERIRDADWLVRKPWSG